ncbi:CoA-binding protein [Tumebacillus algifaecis]|uniref:CoA-binding protein n=1 Tax=Tumebacillus algifaecis TaxID=1214604 RepID=A0A223D448_9BACL|nr:CoA-binding protein [Tumebacillus algifaecis]ASS76203.1 CoA-binding protein [Tumebacillus algifaecis]
MYQEPTHDELRQWLTETKIIAVVGLSDKPERTSYLIADTMQQRGYRIIPVNPMVEEVLGETSYPTLEDVPEGIDLVNVFRRSEELYSVVEAAIKAGAKRIWAQSGVYDEKAAELAKANGVEIVMDQCIAVAHTQLVGGKF